MRIEDYGLIGDLQAAALAFPQAFSHLTLIVAARAISSAETASTGSER